MKHLGDITKISGYDAPTVDIICGGSPCQDLSIAGKRAGLDGERSGLFMEQVRIVKEMREKDEEGQRDRRTDKYIRPRFMVWENVPGAFASPGKRNGEEHRGEDFQAVLTKIARIAKSNCPNVPLPKDRKWPTLDASWESETTDSHFPLPTDYTMHSFGEFPREERESLSSQILEDAQHPISYLKKYQLSSKACQGILNRANRRGKELPKILKEALERQAKLMM